QPDQPRAHRLEVGFEFYEIGFVRHRPMSWNDGVEVELEHTVERSRPIEEAAALRVVDVDRHARRSRRRLGTRGGARRQIQIARMDRLQLWEINNRVAARVAASEVVRLDVLAAEVNVELVRERDARQTDRRTRRVFV